MENQDNQLGINRTKNETLGEVSLRENQINGIHLRENTSKRRNTTHLSVSYLKPTHIEEELQECKDRHIDIYPVALKVLSRVKKLPSHQAGQKETVHRESDNLEHTGDSQDQLSSACHVIHKAPSEIHSVTSPIHIVPSLIHIAPS